MRGHTTHNDCATRRGNAIRTSFFAFFIYHLHIQRLRNSFSACLCVDIMQLIYTRYTVIVMVSDEQQARGGCAVCVCVCVQSVGRWRREQLLLDVTERVQLKGFA